MATGPALSRRSLIAGAAVLPLAAHARITPAQAAAAALPAKAAFAPMEGAYLDSGTMHPVALGAQKAVADYFAKRATYAQGYPTSEVEERVIANFAKLINASPEEIAFVQSTTAGEQLVIEALGLPEKGVRVVSDTLHFFGSFYLYEEMAKRGVDMVWLRPKDNRIAIEEFERAITPGTRLVSLSQVSTYNGFEHDLKAVCEIAHARGAMVYADIIHAAGSVPVDVRATGVDFAACASYKWLMGDFGLGFLYVRADRMADLKHTHFGYYQLGGFRPHVYPFDAPGETVADAMPRKDARGMFAMGTFSHGVLAQLDWSLQFLLELGAARITAYRQPMIDRLMTALPAKGYDLVTPKGSRSALVTCVKEGAYRALAKPLEEAGVKITVSRNRFRVCPSVFNDMDDIERLIAALPQA